MRLALEVVSGPAKGTKIEADVGQTVSIGRTLKANVALGDNFMSGVHFAVECKPKGCVVRDLKSRNGTKLNGELITEAALKDGDRIFAGRSDFIVRIKSEAQNVAVKPESQHGVVAKKPVSRKIPKKLEAPVTPKATPAESGPAAPVTKGPESLGTDAIPAPSRKIRPVHPPVSSPDQPPPPEREIAIPSSAIESYEAATPQGRLLYTLSNQPHTLMALVDAVRDAKLFELLKATREEYQSLYRADQNPSLAPYLVRLPPRCELLKQMIQYGWGHEWGVYLTCPLSLAELRHYFRTSLMVTMTDGMELFSRFYDPRFFRHFLATSTSADAERFFGPVTAYFMEDERSEILLEFAKDKNGVQKKGHLLSDLV